MSIKTYIQMVPSRQEIVDALIVPRLQSFDCIGEVVMSSDAEYRGPLWNFIQIAEMIAASGEAGLILQDDVIFHPQFDELMPDIIEHLQTLGAVSLFCPPRKDFADAYEAGFNWVENRKHLWQPAIALTPEVTTGFLRFASEHTDEFGKDDDVALGAYLKSIKSSMWVTVPSIIQHNIAVGSTLGHPQRIGNIGVRTTKIWQKKMDSSHFKELNSTRI